MSSCKHHCDDINGDEFIGDESEKGLLEGSTGCVQCRKLSTSSSIISYDGKLPIWPDEIRGEELDENILAQPVFLQTRIIFNSAENFEMPVSDQYANASLQNGHVIHSHEHCHTRVPCSKKKHYGPWKQLLAASILCTIFMLTEVIGGYLAGSVAVVTDAAHLLSDLVGFLVSIFAIWLGQLPPTKKLSFGYYRAEVLGALLSVAIIWMLTGIFIYVAMLRLLRGDFEIDANTMMLVSGLGVIINIIMGLTLHGACNHLPHGHSHGGIQSSCKSSQESAHTPGNINIRAATVHVLGDLVQSVGVFVAAIIIKCYPNAKMADPICTFVFSLLMLLTTLSVLRDTLNVLMEGFPKHLDYTLILNTLSSIDGVEHVHNLHVWCLTLDKCAIAVHLAISDSADAAVVLRNALKLIRSKLKIDVITVQIEKYLAPAMDDCQQCKPLID